MAHSNLFDSHTHLHENMDAGQHFVLSGYSFGSNSTLLQKIPSFKNAYFSLGLGPQEIQKEKDYPDFETALSQVELQIQNQASNPLFVAVGEVGLDNHWGKTPEHRLRQFEAFERMIALSKKISKPLVIHSRDAEKECIQLLLAAGCKRVAMHCFGGTLQEAKLACDAGFFISIPPVKSKERKKLIREIPLDSLLVESDAPYIGKTSQEALKSVQMIADYKCIGLEEALLATYENAKRLFF